VLVHDWPPGSDFLTPTSKLKRGPVLQHYHQVIEELYD
jgi:long-subunit acyl-CoA synthetase (AMP-forming)